MPLVSMKPILAHADVQGYGVGAFNTLSLEAVRGAVRAAEELNSPLILQVAQVQLNAAPLEYMAPIMIAAAEKSTVPVAVNFDHGEDIEHIKKALELGFTSVMFDGASLSLEDNIKTSKYVAELAHSYGATCEAELGVVGGSEDGKVLIEEMLTDVNQVKRFVAETDVDALAVAIGNAHGPYKQAPNLQYKRLSEINIITDVPLVLHGGSGIAEEGFRKCIELGIQKINVATSLQQQVIKDVNKLFNSSFKKPDYFVMYSVIEEAICRAVKSHMKIFMSENRSYIRNMEESVDKQDIVAQVVKEVMHQLKKQGGV